MKRCALALLAGLSFILLLTACVRPAPGRGVQPYAPATGDTKLMPPPGWEKTALANSATLSAATQAAATSIVETQIAQNAHFLSLPIVLRGDEQPILAAGAPITTGAPLTATGSFTLTLPLVTGETPPLPASSTAYTLTLPVITGGTSPSALPDLSGFLALLPVITRDGPPPHTFALRYGPTSPDAPPTAGLTALQLAEYTLSGQVFHDTAALAALPDVSFGPTATLVLAIGHRLRLADTSAAVFSASQVMDWVAFLPPGEPLPNGWQESKYLLKAGDRVESTRVDGPIGEVWRFTPGPFLDDSLAGLNAAVLSAANPDTDTRVLLDLLLVQAAGQYFTVYLAPQASAADSQTNYCCAWQACGPAQGVASTLCWLRGCNCP